MNARHDTTGATAGTADASTDPDTPAELAGISGMLDRLADADRNELTDSALSRIAAKSVPSFARGDGPPPSRLKLHTAGARSRWHQTPAARFGAPIALAAGLGIALLALLPLETESPGEAGAPATPQLAVADIEANIDTLLAFDELFAWEASAGDAIADAAAELDEAASNTGSDPWASLDDFGDALFAPDHTPGDGSRGSGVTG
ncbi:MAG: hypothetical protein AAF235_06020 [Planctomycetota bacterium]